MSQHAAHSRLSSLICVVVLCMKIVALLKPLASSEANTFNKTCENYRLLLTYLSPTPQHRVVQPCHQHLYEASSFYVCRDINDSAWS